MEGLLGSERTYKFIILSLVLFISFLIIGLFKLITGSYILGFILFLGLIWYLLREVGSFIMYPGSFFFTRSDIQIRYSREIGSRMVSCFNALHHLSLYIAQRRYEAYENHMDFVVAIDKHLRAITALLEMFETTLSERKVRLLMNYRELRRVIEEKEEGKASIAELIAKPRAILQIQEGDQYFYGSRFAEIKIIVKEIANLLKTFAPPTATVELLRFRMFQQSLYEIRFGFYNWQVLFDYQLFNIRTTGDKSIESAIIHKRRSYFSEQNNSENLSKKTVLFCNPNGVFIQFFGADNEYITNYLKLGYHVVLWNYRGYGQSTGSPSITRSQEDSYSVYKFYRSKGYEIDIVHGYSIGGAAAVGVLDNISKNSQVYPQDKVEILIVDRSFSSIGEMSSQFGKTIHNLTKLVFCTQNIDLSHQFQAAKCKKLLIWDYCDEVIPDKASVKNRIIKRKGQADKKSKSESDEDQQELNEDVQSYQFKQLTSSAQFGSVARKLAHTLGKILEKRKSANNSDKELNFMMEEQRESSLSTALGYDDGNYDFLIKVMDRIDGGGILLFHNINELDHIYSKKSDYFYHVCESYVLGLVCYGSYYPLRPIIHDHQKIKKETLNKINNLLKDIGERYPIDQNNIDLAYNSIDDTIPQIHRNVYHIFRRIMQMIDQYYGEEWFNLHGSLLPTNNGHNSSLSEVQFRILNEFISKSLERDPRELPLGREEIV